MAVRSKMSLEIWTPSLRKWKGDEMSVVGAVVREEVLCISATCTSFPPQWSVIFPLKTGWEKLCHRVRVSYHRRLLGSVIPEPLLTMPLLLMPLLVGLWFLLLMLRLTLSIIDDQVATELELDFPALVQLPVV